MSFSDRFFKQKSGIVELIVPESIGGSDRTAYASVKGILQDDPQIQMGNNWSPISEFKTALDPLQDFQQVVQAESVSSFISGSGMAWKGTVHIIVNCTFYLISFNAKSNIQRSARLLAQLCALDVTGKTKVRPHGGYQLDLFKSNEAITNKDVSYKDLNDISGKKGEDVPGTVTMYVNSRSHTRIPGLLAHSVQIQPSTVTVKNGAPLYYIVNIGFTGYRAPVYEDLRHMFGGR